MKSTEDPIAKARVNWQDPKVTAEDDIIQEGIQRFKQAMDYEYRNRELAEDDIEFRHGDQWPETVRVERERDGRPCLTFNKLEQRIDQIIGDQRQAKPSIRIHPAEANSDVKGKNQAGTKDYTLSEVMNGLIRAIEQNSDAQISYNTAFDHAVGHGFGNWRIITQWDESDPFAQVIRIRRIKNAFSVYWDPHAQEPNAGDANWCFVTSMIDTDAFKRLYPDARATSIDVVGTGDEYEYWFEEDSLRVAEYFRKVPVNKLAVLVSDGSVSYVDDEAELKRFDAELKLKQLRISKWKEATVPKIEWYKMNAGEILEGPREFPSFFIPVVRVIGKELNVRGYDYYRGIVRHAKDAQRLYNYDRTAMVEQVALQPKVPFVLTPEQIESFKNLWERANKDNLPYLLYNHVDGVPPPQRSIPPIPSTAHQINAVADDADVDSTTGLGPASLGQKSNEKSGRAIRERKVEGDTGTFGYHDNLQLALKQTGRILVDMIPRIYDTQRVARILTPEEDDDFIELNHTVLDENGKAKKIHDLSAGRYDIRVSAGPSYTTMREEARDSMLAFASQLPQAGVLIADMIAENMDWPGSQAIAERLRKTLPPGLADDDENQQEITPEMVQQAIQETAQATQEQLDNRIAMMEAETKAYTAQQKAESDEIKNQIELLKALQEKADNTEVVKDLVAQTFAELINETQRV